MLPFVLPDKEVFSLREAGRLLGFDPKTLKKGIDDGKLIAVDVPYHSLTGFKILKRLPRHEVVRLAQQKGLFDGRDSPPDVQP